MYNLEETHVDILDTITTNVQFRRDACRYTGHNNDKCTIQKRCMQIYWAQERNMYNLEEMYVDILDTITKNVESRRDACRYTGQNNEGENKTQKQTNEMSNTDRE